MRWQQVAAERHGVPEEVPTLGALAKLAGRVGLDGSLGNLVILHMVRSVDETVELQQLSVVAGRGWVVSFEEHPGDVFDPVRQRLQRPDSMVRRSGADFLAYALIDAVVDGYFPVIDALSEVMMALTVMASLFIPLTFIAGVYGMNFEVMPELHWRWGYAAAWGVMGAVAVGLLWWFHRKGWLGALRSAPRETTIRGRDRPERGGIDSSQNEDTRGLGAQGEGAVGDGARTPFVSCPGLQ